MMSEVSFGLVVGGFGAAIGAIGAALVNSMGSKAESRAHAADLVVTAAGGLMDRMTARDDRLNRENAELRRALVAMCDLVDDIGPHVPPDEKFTARLKKAASTARDAL